jgi:hypothetical protein
MADNKSPMADARSPTAEAAMAAAARGRTHRHDETAATGRTKIRREDLQPQHRPMPKATRSHVHACTNMCRACVHARLPHHKRAKHNANAMPPTRTERVQQITHTKVQVPPQSATPCVSSATPARFKCRIVLQIQFKHHPARFKCQPRCRALHVPQHKLHAYRKCHPSCFAKAFQAKRCVRHVLRVKTLLGTLAIEYRAAIMEREKRYFETSSRSSAT